LLGPRLIVSALPTAAFLPGFISLDVTSFAAAATLAARGFLPGPRVFFTGAVTVALVDASAIALGRRGARVFFSLIFGEVSAGMLSPVVVGLISSAMITSFTWIFLRRLKTVELNI
jgi:hypothetical protein